MPHRVDSLVPLKQMAITAAATFCATLVDEWAQAGTDTACIAPGSRSTPLALALARHPNISVHLFHDERVAAFAALGRGLATGRPAVVLCSSGTAGTHFHGAVAEADLANVPMLVCTADRPPELWDVGAPQVIDQTDLYGSAVRFFAEPGVPDQERADNWRPLASQCWQAAFGGAGRAGPVHLNLSFADPLVGEPGELATGESQGVGHRTTDLSAAAEDDIARRVSGRRGIIVAGGGAPPPEAVLGLAARLGWPVIADQRSRCRRSGTDAVVIDHFDSLLRAEQFANLHQPEVVLRFGSVTSSKVLGQWLAGLDAQIIRASDGTPSDPDRIVNLTLPVVWMLRALAKYQLQPADPEWATSWSEADETAERAIAAVLATTATSEPGIARRVAEAANGGSLMVSSSMPVRDLEWFARSQSDLTTYSNRGANGIDGVISTAIGIALDGRPTTLLIGDVAFLHDSTALIALARRQVNLTIVVADNDGGGIFSFLPQAELLSEGEYELLFGTPHGTDLGQLARSHGLVVDYWGTDLTPNGVRVIIAHTNRQENVAVHQRLNEAVAEALRS